jgi:hypothetical protein
MKIALLCVVITETENLFQDSDPIFILRELSGVLDVANE